MCFSPGNLKRIYINAEAGMRLVLCQFVDSWSEGGLWKQHTYLLYKYVRLTNRTSTHPSINSLYVPRNLSVSVQILHSYSSYTHLPTFGHISQLLLILIRILTWRFVATHVDNYPLHILSILSFYLALSVPFYRSSFSFGPVRNLAG